MTLCDWPSDTNITFTIKYSHKLALDLAKVLDMNSTSNANQLLLQPFIIIEEPNLEVSTGVKSSSELESNSDEFFEIDREISDAIGKLPSMIDDMLNFF